MRVRLCKWCLPKDVLSLVLRYGGRPGTMLQMWLPDREGKGGPRKRRDEVVQQPPEQAEWEHRRQKMTVVLDMQEVFVDPFRGGTWQSPFQTEHLDLVVAFGTAVLRERLVENRQDHCLWCLRAQHRPICPGFDYFPHFSHHWHQLPIVQASALHSCLGLFQTDDHLSRNF